MKGELQGYLAMLESEPDNERALSALEALAPKVKEDNGLSLEAASRALSNARRVHRERNDWDLVARLLDLELTWTNDASRRADLLYEKGRVLSDELLRDGDAMKCFEKVLELRPGDQAAQEVIAHVSLVRENWEPIAGRYLGEAKTATDRQLQTSLYLSAAELYLRYGPDPAHGEGFLRKALELDARNRKAAAHLERRLRARSAWDELEKLLKQRAETSPQKEERTVALTQLAEIEERRGDKARALEAWKRVLTVDPANPRALRALVESLTAESDWKGLAKVYETALKARPRGEHELALVLQIGMLYWKKLGDLEGAEPFFRRVRKADPAHRSALEFYRAFFGARGDAQKLLVVLQAAAKVETDPEKRLALAVEMARAAEQEAGATEKTIDMWKIVLRMAPKHEEAAQALRRLYRKTEKWNALLELLKDDIDNVPEVDKKIALHLEIAEIYRDKLGLDAMVVATYQNILALKPDHPAALQALAEKYESLGRWNDLISVLTRRADATANPEERVTLLRRIASLWLEKFANANQATRPLEEILAASPDDAQAIAALRDIYTRRRSWKSLLELDRRDVARLAGADKRARLAQMARLAAERLGDAREAIGLWNEALSVDEHDPEALAALSALYEREKRWPALAEILRRQVDTVAEPQGKAVLYERLGALFAERLASPARAAESYRQILVLQPGHAKAQRTLRELYAQQGDFSELERLYADTSQWEELCDALLAAVDRSSDTAARMRLLTRVAEISLERLQRPDRAVKAYERILALEPGNLSAARALVPIYRQGEKWARLLATYEILLAHAGERSERLALLGEIRQLSEHRLGSKGLAFQWCAKAYELDPNDPQIDTELTRLAEEAGAWEDLSALYERRAQGLSDPAEQAALHRRLAKIAKEKTGRVGDARKHWEEVVARAPADGEALSALEQIFTQLAAWPELCGVLTRRAELTEDPARKLEILQKVAFLQEERLGDLAAAGATYRTALEVAHGHAMAKESARILSALERVYAARQQWPELLEALAARLLLADSGEAKAAIYLQQAQVQEEQLHDRGRALLCYREALSSAPGHRPAALALERMLDDPAHKVEVAQLLAPVYEREADPARQARVVEVLFGDAKEEPAKIALAQKLATLYGRKLGAPEKAYPFAALVLEKSPADAAARELMRALAESLGNWEDVVIRFELCALEAEKGSPAATIYAEIAEIYDRQLGKPEKAAEFYAKVAAEDPSGDAAFRELSRLYRQQEKWQDLRGLYESRKARIVRSEERKELLFQICDLDEGVLEDHEHAIATYREVLELDRGNARAWKALERVLTLGEKWGELDALLQDQLEHTAEPQEQAGLRFRRAELRATKLGDLAGAVNLLEEVLAAVPSHDGARKVLERLMGRAELRQRIASILEPYLERDEAYAKLCAILQVQREAAEGSAAVELCARIAALQEEKLASRQAAFLTWREALRLDPSGARGRDNVARLGGMLEKWNDVAQAFEEGFGLAPAGDLSLRADFLQRAAEIYQDRLADPARAQGAWRRLLDLDPQNLQTAQPAVAALQKLYEKSESWTDLVAILRRQIEWADHATARQLLLLRIAEISELRLQDPTAAVATYRELLEEAPEEKTALDALERLYGAGSSWRDQLGILARRVELSRDPAARRDLHLRMAEIQERELNAAAEATGSYLAILDETPDDKVALGELARLYEAAGRFSDLREILLRQLALAGADEDKLALMHRLAGLAEEKLGRLDAALERWQEILALSPTDGRAIAGVERALADEALKLRAAEVLEPIWRTRGDLSKQVSLHELLAEASGDPEVRVARRSAAAALKEKLGDADGAFDCYARAAQDALGGPDLAGILDALERLANERRRHGDLVTLYREIGPDVLDAQLGQRISLVVADLARTRLADPELAKEQYRRVLEAAPDHPRALAALEALYAEAQEWEPLFEICQRRAELSQDADEKREYLLRAAVLSEEKLLRPGEAIPLYEQVLEVAPGDRDALGALDRLYREATRPADLADLLERRLGFAEEIEEAVKLRFQLGELYEQTLRDPDRAVENYRATLGGEPGHAGAIAALERYLEDPAQQGGAAEVLEPVYAARQDWPKLVRIYEIRLLAAEDPKLRLQLLRRIARLYEEQLEDLEHAFRWYGKVFRESPDDRMARDQLVRLAGILERWRELAEIYQGYLDETLEPGPAWSAVCWTLADLYGNRLQDVDRAKDCYERLREQSPEDPKVFEALERTLVRAGRFQDVLDLYEDAAAKEAEPQKRQKLLLRIAQVYEENLGDADATVGAYRRILDLEPDDAGALFALERLFESGEKWHDLIELVSARLARAEGADQIALRFRLGMLLEQRLDDSAGAIDAYEECLRADPRHAPALAALERLVLDRDHRLRIAQILEPLYRDQDEWAKLVVIYEAQLEFIEDAPRRVEILREIARLHEQRGRDVGRAWDALVRGFRVDPAQPESLAELTRLAGATGRYRDLVAALEQAAGEVYDPDVARALNARAAEIYTGELKNSDAAIAAWKRVLESKDDDQEALSALSRLYQSERRFEELSECLERQSDLAEDGEARKELLAQAAALEEQTLERPERAIELHRRVLTLDEADAGALSALERLYETAGDMRQLADILGRQAELAGQGRERRDILGKLARVYENELSDRFEAIGCYKAARELDPNDADALAALDRLYLAEQMWADLLEVLEAELALAGAPAAREELRFRIARVLEQETGDVDGAIARYEEVLKTLPEHAGARDALFALTRAEGTREPAAAALEPYLRGRKEWDRLAEILELRLEAESDPARRRQLLCDLAALHETGRRDLQAAFAAWGRVLAEDAGDADAQRELERLAGARGGFADLAALYEDRLSSQYDAEIGRALALKLATIYEDALGDAARAVEKLRTALEFPGEERAPLSALDRLLESLGRWDELCEVLEREGHASLEPAEQAGFLDRLARIRLERLSDHDGAIGAWRDVLDREPGHDGAIAGLAKYLDDATYREEAIRILEPVYETQNDAKNLVRLEEVKLALREEPLERARLLERIAELEEKSLHDAARALDAYARALCADPGEARYAEEVARLGDVIKQPGEAAARIAQAADAAEERSRDSARELRLRAGTLWLERAQDLAPAETQFRRVLEQDPDHVDALAALELILRERKDDRALYQVLRKQAEQELDLQKKRARLAEAAALAERVLGDVEAAIASWNAALEVDEHDRAALSELARLYDTAGRWEELAQALERQARASDDPAEQVELYVRAAQVYVDRQNELDRAADAYRAALDARPGDDGVLSALEEVHGRREDWLAVQEVLTQRLQAATTPAAQVAVYRKLAALAIEHRESPEEAIGFLLQALDADGSDESLLAELERLLTTGELVRARRRAGETRGRMSRPRRRGGRARPVGRVGGGVGAPHQQPGDRGRDLGAGARERPRTYRGTHRAGAPVRGRGRLGEVPGCARARGGAGTEGAGGGRPPLPDRAGRGPAQRRRGVRGSQLRARSRARSGARRRAGRAGAAGA
jgi:tetratricopeptide (TPR) repeat protein